MTLTVVRFLHIVTVVELGVLGRIATPCDSWITPSLHVKVELFFIPPANPFLLHHHPSNLSPSTIICKPCVT